VAGANSKRKRCIGHGPTEGRCGKLIDARALALNESGLWCEDCEKSRREAISLSMQSVLDAFDKPAEQGRSEAQ
jgi:hypothetical protein